MRISPFVPFALLISVVYHDMPRKVGQKIIPIRVHGFYQGDPFGSLEIRNFLGEFEGVVSLGEFPEINEFGHAGLIKALLLFEVLLLLLFDGSRHIICASHDKGAMQFICQDVYIVHEYLLVSPPLQNNYIPNIFDYIPLINCFVEI